MVALKFFLDGILGFSCPFLYAANELILLAFDVLKIVIR